MPARPLLVIGLDGFDPGIAARLTAEGRLPHLRRLEQQAHRFRLDHGIEKRAGLAWEQFSSGLAPTASGRWSEVSVDTRTYVPHQVAAHLAPFTAGLSAEIVVFDVPYFNLPLAGRASGMVSWGTHDPGIDAVSSPPELLEELATRFGPYPAGEFLYGHVWPNAERARTMGRRLVEAVELRAKATRWLLGERLPTWDLAMVTIGEYHSAVEALWHGWDPDHPLHGLRSGPVAREGLVAVYEAADRMLGELVDAFPRARVLTFTMHGMGRNLADVPAMLLVPELLYRHFTGRRGFEPDPAWTADGCGSPDLARVPHWATVICDRLSIQAAKRPFWRRGLRQEPTALDWMPASRYHPAWPGMRAYAMPSYTHARIRLNLKGRESRGLVPVRHYGRTLDEIAALMTECTDPRTGRALDIEIERRENGDPRARPETDADLMVHFRTDHYAFEHPRLGTIGPAPCRRPGGHTGGPGGGCFLDRSQRGRDLGRFPTIQVSDAIRALVDGRVDAAPLGRALREAEAGPARARAGA